MLISRTCGPVVLLAVLTIPGAAAPQPPAFEPYQPDLTAAGTLSNAAADLDGDGDTDLFVGFNGAANRLLRNDDGRLTDVAAAMGVADGRATRAAAWGDIDADGDSDLLVGFAPGAGPVLRLYRNLGRRFEDATAGAGLLVPAGAVRQPAWVDVDDDGDLDLFVAFRDRPNALYRNDGGSFTDIAASVGLADARKSVGAVWFDYDEDGDLDLYVANQDGDANGLFRHDGGRFSDVADAAGVAWAGRTPRDATRGTVRPCAADVDGDGRLDLVTANYGANGLFLNRGDGTFADASARWGLHGEGRHDTCAPADVDNDGRLDLYVNGTVSERVSHRDYLFRNLGERFADVTPPALLALPASHGALWADLDGDGDQDLALAGTQPEPFALVWRNLLPRAASRRFVMVRVVDGDGRATRAGAEIRVYAAGSRTLLGTRLVDTGSGYNAQSDVPVHFGVGDAAAVDAEVRYPGGGRRRLTRLAALATGSTRPIVMRVPTSAPPPAPRDVIFVPTRESVADEMLKMAGVAAGDVVYDLGSGDGRIPILAAQKYGARGVGIEIDPQLVAVARSVARDGEVDGRVTFIQGDLFDADLSAATVVTLYLSPGVNARLEPRLRQLRPGTRIVSHQFPIGRWTPDRTMRAEDGTLLYLWTIPARQQPPGG